MKPFIERKIDYLEKTIIDLKGEKEKLKLDVKYYKKQLIIHGVVASVLCVDKEEWFNYTIGEKYAIIAETPKLYVIENDLGELKSPNKKYFKKQ